MAEINRGPSGFIWRGLFILHVDSQANTNFELDPSMLEHVEMINTGVDLQHQSQARKERKE